MNKGGLTRISEGLNSASIKHLSTNSYWSDSRDNELGCAHAVAGEVREGDWDIENAVACAWTYATNPTLHC